MRGGRPASQTGRQMGRQTGHLAWSHHFLKRFPCLCFHQAAHSFALTSTWLVAGLRTAVLSSGWTLHGHRKCFLLLSLESPGGTLMLCEVVLILAWVLVPGSHKDNTLQDWPRCPVASTPYPVFISRLGLGSWVLLVALW